MPMHRLQGVRCTNNLRWSLLLRRQPENNKNWTMMCRSNRQPSLSAASPSSRSMSIYAVGEGWTGALTRKNVSRRIEGHFDEETTEFPAVIYDDDNVKQAAAGWGCSAMLDDEGQVYVVGRPQDLMTLFRLNRMPKLIRDWANTSSDPGDTTIVGTMITKLIGIASGGDEEKDWEVAKQLSWADDWTKLELQKTTTSDDGAKTNKKSIGDAKIKRIACGAGVMAAIGESGTLYTLGLNNRGQCGIGKLSNNVWSLEPVQGINAVAGGKISDKSQNLPVVQVELGFQHGLALTETGQVFSWGKGQRGQLGRKLGDDFDSKAGPIELNSFVTQIACGMHHGALLTSDNNIYVWGKFMSHKSSPGKPTDALEPELVEGLPVGLKVLQISAGSHHTAILMEDGSVYAVGVASDEAIPLLEPVQLIGPDQLAFPIRQFEAHRDRTTIIDNDGQVFQANLWKDESLREHAVFTPSFADLLIDDGQSIQAIHRGWLHTIIVTKPDQ